MAARPKSHLDRPLDTVLSSAGSMKVLRVMITHGGPLPLSKIAREADLTVPGARKIIEHLTPRRVVTALGSNQTRLYQVSRDNLIVGMLGDLFETETKFRSTVMTLVKEAAEGLGIVALWVFGSVARRQDRPDSDLDIMAVTDQRERESLALAEQFRRKLEHVEDRTGLRPQVAWLTMDDLKPLIKNRNPLWEDVREDSLVLAGPSPAELRQSLIEEKRP